MTKKLVKVLEYLVKNEEGKAKELLHQVFIEKARAIHEELINDDEEMEMDEVACSDDGDNFRRDVRSSDNELDELADEIEAEETMAEDDDFDIDDAEGDIDVDMDMGDDDIEHDGGLGDDLGPMDDMGDDDMGDDDMGNMDDMDSMGDDAPNIEDLANDMQDLEDALAELKAEFEKLESGEDGDMGDDDMGDDDMGDDDMGDDDMGDDDMGDDDMGDDIGDDDMGDDDMGDDDMSDTEEEMDESWLAEFDDLDESVSLEKVPVVKGEGEVGSGSYSKVEANTKSPVGKAPTSLMGAKPVKTGEGSTKSGYNKETAPSTKGQLPHTEDNRRKKSTDKTSKVSKEGNSSAKLNKDSSDGFGQINKKSPLSSSPRK